MDNIQQKGSDSCNFMVSQIFCMEGK